MFFVFSEKRGNFSHLQWKSILEYSKFRKKTKLSNIENKVKIVNFSKAEKNNSKKSLKNTPKKPGKSQNFQTR